MDRLTVSERLNAVRPDSADLAEPEMAAVREALADEDMRADFSRRVAWDRGLSAAMVDVPLPDGLQSRILARLATEPTAVSRARRPSVSRRMVLSLLAGLAASVVAAVAFWTVAGPTDPVTLAELRTAAADPGQIPFDGSFEPQLPSESWRSRLSINEMPFGVLRQRRTARAAAWEFALGGRLDGVLIAVPVDRVVSPPPVGSIGSAEYEPQPGGYEVAAWTQGDFVYVCRVRGRVGDLVRRLEPIAV